MPLPPHGLVHPPRSLASPHTLSFDHLTTAGRMLNTYQQKLSRLVFDADRDDLEDAAKTITSYNSGLAYTDTATLSFDAAGVGLSSKSKDHTAFLTVYQDISSKHQRASSPSYFCQIAVIASLTLPLLLTSDPVLNASMYLDVSYLDPLPIRSVTASRGSTRCLHYCAYCSHRLSRSSDAESSCRPWHTSPPTT